MKLLKMYSFEDGWIIHPKDAGFNFTINSQKYSFEYDGDSNRVILEPDFYNYLTVNWPYNL